MTREVLEASNVKVDNRQRGVPSRHADAYLYAANVQKRSRKKQGTPNAPLEQNEFLGLTKYHQHKRNTVSTRQKPSP
jgi:hypothetical protein